MTRTLMAAAFGLFLLPVDSFGQDYEEVRARLQTLANVEDSRISIAESPINGMLQIRLGSEIVYMTDDARFLVQGRLFDLDTREDLTDRAMSEVRKGLIKELASARTIDFGPEDADYSLYVFTDVDCGYCRRLHEQIAEYNDAGIRIRYAAFPRAGIGSETFRKMNSVWCAADPHAAMDFAKAGNTPEPASCDSPVAQQYQLGQSMGVTGTPALLTTDGDLIPGYVPPQDLRKRLEMLHERNSAVVARATD
ncbi:MAG: DsbC family protein [Gammaproteobacteria bacterium]|nr:DsbC family protein [Gammaproteobacteria bacterium]